MEGKNKMSDHPTEMDPQPTAEAVQGGETGQGGDTGQGGETGQGNEVKKMADTVPEKEQVIDPQPAASQGKVESDKVGDMVVDRAHEVLTPVPALQVSHAVSDQSESAVESSEAGEAVESATSHETIVHTQEESEPEDANPRKPSQSNGISPLPSDSETAGAGKQHDIVAETDAACSVLTPLNPVQSSTDVEQGRDAGICPGKDTEDSTKKELLLWVKRKEVLFCLISGLVLLIGIILIVIGITTMNQDCPSVAHTNSENGFEGSGPAYRSGQGVLDDDEFDETVVDYKHIHSHDHNKTEEEVEELNIAVGKDVYQSSSGTYNASLAVDGNIDNKFWENACSQTGIQVRPYWYVDLGSPQAVKRVKLYTPSDCCMGELHDFEVRVGDETEDFEMNSLCKHHMGTALKVSINIVCDHRMYGQFVSIQLLGDADRPRDRLTLCEVMVFG